MVVDRRMKEERRLYAGEVAVVQEAVVRTQQDGSIQAERVRNGWDSDPEVYEVD